MKDRSTGPRCTLPAPCRARVGLPDGLIVTIATYSLADLDKEIAALERDHPGAEVLFRMGEVSPVVKDRLQ